MIVGSVDNVVFAIVMLRTYHVADTLMQIHQVSFVMRPSIFDVRSNSKAVKNVTKITFSNVHDCWWFG